MKKKIAVILTTSISGYGLLQIFNVATQGCIAVNYKSFEALACGLEGYLQGIASFTFDNCLTIKTNT